MSLQVAWLPVLFARGSVATFQRDFHQLNLRRQNPFEDRRSKEPLRVLFCHDNLSSGQSTVTILCRHHLVQRILLTDKQACTDTTEMKRT